MKIKKITVTEARSKIGLDLKSITKLSPVLKSRIERIGWEPTGRSCAKISGSHFKQFKMKNKKKSQSPEQDLKTA